MEVSDFKTLNFSVLGQDSTLSGDFKFRGDILLGSKLSGSLTMLDEGKVIIERNSIVDAEISCHDIEIFGQFTGKINASGTLSVRSSAKISGEIRANKMSIFPGAQINMEGHTEENSTKS